MDYSFYIIVLDLFALNGFAVSIFQEGLMERLDKLISNSGTLSRKEVHRLIKSGRVSVDGITIKDRGFNIDPQNANIKIDGTELQLQKYTYIMMNKPQGVISAARDGKEKTVIDLVPADLRRKNLFPAGRLDKDTTGFMLITDNGDFAHKILSPKNHISKTYEARLSLPITDAELEKIRLGITLGDGTECMPAEAEISEDTPTPLVKVVICEGKYHQIKRMFASLGNNVQELKRVKMGALCLDETLLPGECRVLTENEIKLISG